VFFVKLVNHVLAWFVAVVLPDAWKLPCDKFVSELSPQSHSIFQMASWKGAALWPPLLRAFAGIGWNECNPYAERYALASLKRSFPYLLLRKILHRNGN